VRSACEHDGTGPRLRSGQKKEAAFLDRHLTLWIFLAITAGVSIGHFVPGSAALVNHFQTRHDEHPCRHRVDRDDYPPLTKVRYEKLEEVFRNRRVLGLSLSSFIS
jgi:arsenite transporter